LTVGLRHIILHFDRKDLLLEICGYSNPSRTFDVFNGNMAITCYINVIKNK